MSYKKKVTGRALNQREYKIKNVGEKERIQDKQKYSLKNGHAANKNCAQIIHCEFKSM